MICLRSVKSESILLLRNIKRNFVKLVIISCLIFLISACSSNQQVSIHQNSKTSFKHDTKDESFQIWDSDVNSEFCSFNFVVELVDAFPSIDRDSFSMIKLSNAHNDKSYRVFFYHTPELEKWVLLLKKHNADEAIIVEDLHFNTGQLINVRLVIKTGIITVVLSKDEDHKKTLNLQDGETHQFDFELVDDEISFVPSKVQIYTLGAKTNYSEIRSEAVCPKVDSYDDGETLTFTLDKTKK